MPSPARILGDRRIAVPSATVAEAADFLFRSLLELHDVHLGGPVQGHGAGFEDDVVEGPHVRGQGAGMALQLRFGEVGAGPPFDKGDDALAPEAVLVADHADIRNLVFEGARWFSTSPGKTW